MYKQIRCFQLTVDTVTLETGRNVQLTVEEELKRGLEHALTPLRLTGAIAVLGGAMKLENATLQRVLVWIHIDDHRLLLFNNHVIIMEYAKRFDQANREIEAFLYEQLVLNVMTNLYNCLVDDVDTLM